MNPIGNDGLENPNALPTANPISNGTSPEDTSKSPLKQIRTFQGDVAEALHTQNESLVSIERAEQAKRRTQPVEDGGETKAGSKKTWLLIVGTFVLIIGGLAGGWFSYKEYRVKTAVPIVVAPENKFFASKSIDIDTTGLDRAAFVAKITEMAMAETLATESAQLELREGPGSEAELLPTTKFFNILDSEAPGNLVRALDPMFMFGLTGVNKNTFLIFKLSSYENAYAGMLEWESGLVKDLGPLMSTYATLGNISETTLFEDIVIKNKDARAIKDAEGNVLILYTFFDDKLIITDSKDTLNTVIDRLTSEKLTR